MSVQELQRLAVVSKVARILAKHTNVCDRTLAEYAIDLYSRQDGSLEREMAGLGAEEVMALLSRDSLAHPINRAESEIDRDKIAERTRRSELPETSPAQTDLTARIDRTGRGAGRDQSESERDTYQNESETSRSEINCERSTERGRSGYRGEKTETSERTNRTGRAERDGSETAGTRSKPIEVGREYTCRIAGITKFGAFATILGVVPKTDGLIHISELAEQRVDKVEDVVAKGDTVTARIIKIQGKRINLSLRANAMPVSQPAQSRKRLSSPERFELRQLVAAGVASAHDIERLAADTDDADDHVEIEVSERPPPFLQGETLPRAARHIEQAPDGVLAKAAAKSGQLARERHEARAAKKTEARGDDDASLVLDTRPAPKEPHVEPIKVELPIHAARKEILDTIRDNQVTVVVGDTGSGKTTQLTQFLYAAGYGDKGIIACTQPRRVAAVSIAQRVAEEMNAGPVGGLVGYTIRFEDYTSDKTRIKYMTDGILERDVLGDRDVNAYSVIMLDEAHERTIATDVLFALLKTALAHRPDLRLIVTSATLDADRFSNYFNGAPVLRIPGRTYPVDILWSKAPEPDYLGAALLTAMQIHLSQPKGDILIFLTGQEEIETAATQLAERAKALGPALTQKLDILPVYSAQPSELQTRIFAPAAPNTRKCVIATNIAETSLTIDGIRYVVDPGFVKVNVWDPRLGMDNLRIVPVSQAQANQRSGRAGRTSPGKCYRLYTEEAFKTEMRPTSVPEIQRQNLAHTILMLKAMGIQDLLKFDFMDPPPREAMLGALAELYQLGALDSEGLLTRAGRQMADFPMEPAMAKVLIQSVDAGCAHEMLSVLAMLSMPSVFYRPSDVREREEADRRKRHLNDASGDHLTMLNVYSSWVQSGYSRKWCSDHFVQERSMRRAKDVRQQLLSLLQRYGRRISSCHGSRDIVLQVLCAGYFRNTAKQSREGYRTLADDTEAAIHPSSALFGKSSEYVLYHSLVFTSREYMHGVSAIKPGWLVAAAPAYFDQVQGTKRRKKEGIQPLFNRYAEHDDEWRISAQKKYVKYESKTF